MVLFGMAVYSCTVSFVGVSARRYHDRGPDKMRIHDLLRLLICLQVTACAQPTAQQATPQVSGPGKLARASVAELLATDLDEVRLIEVTAKEFSDSSLGCPEPGMSYLQVITAGHQVLVEADGRRFDVRVSNGHARICRRHKPRPGNDDGRAATNLTDLTEQAREDLSRRLEIPPSSVSLLGVNRYTATSELPGCQPVCKNSRECGHVVGLLHNDRRYLYHVSSQGVLPCPPLQRS